MDKIRVEKDKNYYIYHTGKKIDINYFIDIPKICPFCGIAAKIDVLPQGRYYKETVYRTKTSTQYTKYYVAFMLYSTCCDKPFVGDFECDTLGEATCIDSFPKAKRLISFSDTLIKLSPEFVSTYKEVLYAESEGLEKLARLGLCSAFEQLVYDYIIKVLGKKPEFSLAKNIKMLSDNNSRINANIAKIIRNNEVHPFKTETELTTKDLKACISNITLYFEADYSTYLLDNKSSTDKKNYHS